MKRIIITGANEGIGFYLIKELLRQGNQVAVLDIETDQLSSMQKAYPEKLSSFGVISVKKMKSTQRYVLLYKTWVVLIMRFIMPVNALLSLSIKQKQQRFIRCWMSIILGESIF